MSKQTKTTDTPTSATNSVTNGAATDRRAATRQAISLPCCIRTQGRLRSDVGRTRNVSLSGALVQMPPISAQTLGGRVYEAGDVVHLALVPPATGLVGAVELKPARVVRVDESIRGTVTLALHWDVEQAPGLLGEVLAEKDELSLAA